MCGCSSDDETTIRFLIHFANCNTQRKILFDKIPTVDANILTENEDSIVNPLLFEKSDSENSISKAMPNASLKFTLLTDRFNNPLF